VGFFIPTYSPTHLLTYSLTHLPTYPLTHLPTYPLTHLPTYPLTHLPLPYTELRNEQLATQVTYLKIIACPVSKYNNCFPRRLSTLQNPTLFPSGVLKV